MHDLGRAPAAALIFPFALLAAVFQGGSCRSEATNANAANANAPVANAAPGNLASTNRAERRDIGGSMSQNPQKHDPPADRSEKARGVAKGLWGGPHVRLEVRDDGASVEYDCGHGSINERLVVDAEGRFDVAGFHVNERGGPVREGEQPETHPARYTGRVEGDRMSLHVTVTGTKLDPGDFTLTHGRGARLVKCL